jgi:serine O-acetyltransferase
MSNDPDWNADLARYPERPFLREQSIWAIWIYRFGRRVDRCPAGFRKRLLTKIYWAMHHSIATLLATSFTKSVRIGPGLRIHHFGCIFIHPNAVIGANCTLRQGVTIGNREDGGGVPVIGDNVEFGAFAQVLGNVRVGNDCRIGPWCFVTYLTAQPRWVYQRGSS